MKKMKILHIFRSAPDTDVTTLSAAWAEGNEVSEFHLNRNDIDYDELVRLIFENDKALCWF